MADISGVGEELKLLAGSSGDDRAEIRLDESSGRGSKGDEVKIIKKGKGSMGKREGEEFGIWARYAPNIGSEFLGQKMLTKLLTFIGIVLTLVILYDDEDDKIFWLYEPKF